MESEVLRRFYSDVQHAITNPVGVTSLLHQEGVVGEVLLDEVSPTNKVSPVEKTASIMRHVEAAIRVDPKSFWVFLSVLDQFTPSRYLAERMRQAVDLHASGSYQALLILVLLRLCFRLTTCTCIIINLYSCSCTEC